MEQAMLERNDLLSLEDYSTKREEFRSEVLTYKKNRRVLIGAHVLLVFENELTIRYQIQEMLRIEKVFEASGIQEELDAYNPLIPDGNNWKCSMLIQYPEVEERRERLADLKEVEHRVWVQIGDSDKVFALADEDLERSNDDKTSAVHFLRFQLNSALVLEAKKGAWITFGVDHDKYQVDPITVPESIRVSLSEDLK
ncbi:MAG: hypothetical protein ACI8Z1_000480 [Candidatus Azotimanducaceae bacterium]|jgi:hypothetical protein